MKRYVSLITVVALFLLLVACGNTPMKDPGNFYYRRIDTDHGSMDSVIKPEQREVYGIRNHIGEILTLYLQGPQDKSLESPFPRNTTIEKWAIVDNSLLLTLSPEFAQLSGIDLTIACGCITRTMTELAPIQRVNFQVTDSLLNGERSITMTKKSLQLVDDSLARLATNVTVYYSDDRRRYLVGQEVSINLAEDVNVVEYLIDQLCTPPKDTDLLSPLPDGTRLLDFSIENKVCKLNFSSEFDHKVWRDAEAQRLSLLSVVNTLTQLPEIEHVEFYSEGNLITQYRLLRIPGPMSLDERAIGPVRNGINEFDATLYLANGCNEYLVAVPTRIRQIAGITKAEMIVQELISYQSANGFAAPIPKNTAINYVTVEGDTCYIDLNSAFVSSPDLVPLAIRSLISSTCALPEIKQTVITVNGGTPTGELKHLFEITTVDPEWIP